MVVAFAPFAIFIGAAATGGLLFWTLWQRFSSKTTERITLFGSLLERADIRMSAEEIVLSIIGVTAILWIAVTILLHSGIVTGLLLLPVCAALGAGGFYVIVQYRLRRRLNTFIEQLETVLRTIAGSVRIGYSLRQALGVVIQEIPDPARYEYQRVLGKTNIGVSIYDALDDLTERLTCNETRMMARAIRIQSTTGGDLSRILEDLANTIKERRRLGRKISALTAEGRASAGLLTALPPLLTVFIALTERDMGHALMFTMIGHVALVIVGVLEGLGIFTLNRMIKANV